MRQPFPSSPYPDTDPSSPDPRSRFSGSTYAFASPRRPKLCYLDSPHPAVDATEPLWWSGRPDSSSVIWRPDAFPLGQVSHAQMSTAEQIELVVHTLGFGKRQLAELFGVSRQAIYDWLKGGNIRDENADRLEKLARLVLSVSHDTRRPLYYRFTTRPVAEGEPSLLDLLHADPWDEPRVRAQLRQARYLTTQRQALQGKERAPSTKSSGDDRLTDNLLSLGEG